MQNRISFQIENTFVKWQELFTLLVSQRRDEVCLRCVEVLAKAKVEGQATCNEENLPNVHWIGKMFKI